MQMTTFKNDLIRKLYSIALTCGAVLFLSNLFPDYAVGQSGVASATQSPAPATNESKSSPVEQGESNGMKVFALRLRPGQDLRKEIERFTKERGLKAGFIITTVGSLEKATLRLADQNNASSFAGKFEIVSLVGTLSQDGVHLHVSLSDSTGRTIGGHLVEGCQIYTTAEIVIGEAKGIVFAREADQSTGYKELTIHRYRRPRKRGN
jgi:predicted DNA-binding protein with PD1-like motif